MALDVEDNIADHVLAHVEDERVDFVGRGEGDWVDDVGDGNGEVGLGGELDFGGNFFDNCVGPVGGGEVWGVPAGSIEACVVDFASVDLGEEGGCRGGLPSFVGGDGLVRAVGEGDVELGAKGIGIRVFAGAGPGHRRAVPART
jgi:hypothetical protein